MIVCSAVNISKQFGGNEVFNDISFDIYDKDRIGIVGRNGSGKTSLMRILAKEDSCDAGDVHFKKETKVGYLSQIPNVKSGIKTIDVLKSAFSELLMIEERMRRLEQSISVETCEKKLASLVSKYGDLQEKFMDQNGYEMDSLVNGIADGLNLNPLLQKRFDQLSGGEKTKVGLCYLLLQKPNVLLLDEPTNHLDMKAIDWLSQFISNYDGTVIVVSHDRYFLDDVVNKIFDIEDGELTIYHGDYSNFVKEKEERLLREFQQYEEQQKKIKKMQEAIKRLRDWANRANPPNEGLHKRARNMERALERMTKLNRPVLNRKKMSLDLSIHARSGNDIITMKNVSKAFGEKKLFAEAQMHIRFKDRAVLLGENGTGKSTLLQLIMKQLEPDTGEVTIGSNVKIGYISQHVYSDIDDRATVLDVFREEVKVSEGEARHILAKFLFYGHSVFKKVSQLSGGEKMRLRLAQLMYQDINLLILDEPTNHLDIESREVLEETLEEYEGTILAVSHDRYFINKLFHKVYWIEDGQLHFIDGNYDWAKKKMIEHKETNMFTKSIVK